MVSSLSLVVVAFTRWCECAAHVVDPVALDCAHGLVVVVAGAVVVVVVVVVVAVVVAAVVVVVHCCHSV